MANKDLWPILLSNAIAGFAGGYGESREREREQERENALMRLQLLGSEAMDPAFFRALGVPQTRGTGWADLKDAYAEREFYKNWQSQPEDLRILSLRDPETERRLGKFGVTIPTQEAPLLGPTLTGEVLPPVRKKAYPLTREEVEERRAQREIGHETARQQAQFGHQERLAGIEASQAWARQQAQFGHQERLARQREASDRAIAEIGARRTTSQKDPITDYINALKIGQELSGDDPKKALLIANKIMQQDYTGLEKLLTPEQKRSWWDKLRGVYPPGTGDMPRSPRPRGANPPQRQAPQASPQRPAPRKRYNIYEEE